MKAIVKEYDAFISYRHCELDSFVAEQLHKRLEAFRLPKYLAEQRKTGEKTRISRVFRDKEELPLATNLSDPIQEALEKSEFLIAICTPRLLESEWCKKEIETFIQLHGRDHVLAVLAEGEPEDSFPESLLKEEVKERGFDGIERTVYRDVEPLAADVRGKTKKEIAKKIKKEVLRMAAPMFDCAYDDIRQRHKEQKLKRRVQISMAISAVLFIFCTISVAQGIEIKEQSQVIQTQYQENLKAQSEILSTIAEEKLEAGDRKMAMEYALQALPIDFEDPERPIVPEAVYTLTSALRTYDNGSCVRPDFYLEQSAEIVVMRTLGDDYLFTIDEKGIIWIWNVENRKVVAKYRSDYVDKRHKNVVDFNGTECFYVAGKDSINAYSITEQKKLWTQSIENPEYLYYNALQKEIFVVSDNQFYLLDAESGEIKNKTKMPEECRLYYVSAVQSNSDGSQYYIAFQETDSILLKVQGSDLQTEVFLTCDKGIEGISLSEDDTKLFCMMNNFEKDTGLISATIDGMVASYSLETKECIWEYHDDLSVEGIYPLEDQVLLIHQSRGLAKVDSETGSEIESVEMDNRITGLYQLTSGRFQMLLKDGAVWFEFDNFAFSRMAATYQIIGTGFEEFKRMGDNYFTLESNAKRILVYNAKLSEWATESSLTEEQVRETYGKETEESNKHQCVSKEKEQIASVDEERDAIVFMSEDEEEEQGEYSCSTTSIEKMFYSPDGEILFVAYSDGFVEWIDTDIFSCINTCEDLPEINTCEVIKDEYLAFVSVTETYIYERKTGKCIAKVDGYIAYDEEENVFYIVGSDKVYTIPFFTAKELVDLAYEGLE